LNEVIIQRSVEDVPLSKRILNVEGIWENHGYISEPKNIQEKVKTHQKFNIIAYGISKIISV